MGGAGHERDDFIAADIVVPLRRVPVLRVSGQHPPDPGGSGECELVLQARASVSLCRGRRFFRLAPERAAEYRAWVLGGAGRTPMAGPAGDS